MNENEYNQYCNGCKLIFDHYGEENQLNKLIEECSATAKTLEYESEYHLFTGCVLTKPTGKKVLLKQLRDYGE